MDYKILFTLQSANECTSQWCLVRVELSGQKQTPHYYNNNKEGRRKTTTMAEKASLTATFMSVRYSVSVDAGPSKYCGYMRPYVCPQAINAVPLRRESLSCCWINLI